MLQTWNISKKIELPGVQEREREKMRVAVGVQCVCVWERSGKCKNLKYLPRRCSQCNRKGTGLLLVDSCFEHDQATKTEEPAFTHSVIFLNIKRQNIQSERFIK